MYGKKPITIGVALTMTPSLKLAPTPLCTAGVFNPSRISPKSRIGRIIVRLLLCMWLGGSNMIANVIKKNFYRTTS
jgi:hypothetical protein